MALRAYRKHMSFVQSVKVKDALTSIPGHIREEEKPVRNEITQQRASGWKGCGRNSLDPKWSQNWNQVCILSNDVFQATAKPYPTNLQHCKVMCMYMYIYISTYIHV